ncbi:hypothetical protein [Roseateles terrae]|uniref:TOMM leader peptide-binding protein n=1 Tax=Roseateles terrae TaxID=431060 RepID=A0ABR6GL93_9BURK|nr:hypothetical protein [Roseateles terrae]MBB3192861.1 hypothetical protein [Roseateles terrae]OWQ89878.1 hypothetical protein CDN98_05090 [Roseateles terrae]
MDTLLPGADAPLRLTLLHGRRDLPLAQALAAPGPQSDLPAASAAAARFVIDTVEVNADDALVVARQLAEDHQLALFIDRDGQRDGCGETALRINQLWQQRQHPGLFLLRSGRGDELVAVRHPGQSSCLQCWHAQLQNFPWLQGDSAADDADDAHDPHAAFDTAASGLHATTADLAAALRRALQTLWQSPTALEGEVLRLGPDGMPRRIRMLRDPICPHCTDWSRRPTQAFYVQSTEAA